MRLLPLALGSALALSGCGTRLTDDKVAYAGVWEGPGMFLSITMDGHVEYERNAGGSTTSVNAPLQGFEGDDFSAGVWIFSADFDVETPPTLVDGVWTMRVDGVDLVRVEEP